MPEDGRLTAFLDEVHRRLTKARTAVRRDPPTVEELLQRRRSRDQAEVAESEGMPEEELQAAESTDTTEDRVLVTPPPDRRETDERSGGSNFTIGEGPSSPQCKLCGQAVETTSPDQAQTSVCRECLTEGYEVTPPTTDWQHATLTELSEAILQVLQAAYPEDLSAPEIADRIRQRDDCAVEADKSEVNSRLYGSLREWLEREGETPPYWSLKGAELDIEEEETEEARSPDTPASSEQSTGRCSSCGGSVEGSTYIGNTGVLCESCAAVERKGQRSDTSWEERVFDARDEPSSSEEDLETAPSDGPESEDNSGPLAEHGEGMEGGRQQEETQTEQAKAEEPEVNYELCHMCITEYPEESLTRYNGLQLCPGCLEEDR